MKLFPGNPCRSRVFPGSLRVRGGDDRELPRIGYVSEFVINLRTAKQIGLTIPPNVLARADRVIK